MTGKNIIFGYVAIPILLLAVSFSYVGTSLNVSTLCIEQERVALLRIRKDLKDLGNCLSSWVGKDCCDWTGIQCDNQTGHVLKLDLQTPNIFTNTSEGPCLSGELNPSLTYLKHLTHLDLSYSDFQGIPIPKFIGSLSMLRYLDLSNANFSGMVPPQIGNLSNLKYLDISDSFSSSSLWVGDISWLSLLISLQYLGMSGINITSTTNELFRAVNMIPSLLELHLSYCHLGTLPPSLPFENITSLSVLDLSENPFNSTLPSWLSNLSTLTELTLSSTSLGGSLSGKLARGNLCKLQKLDLSYNQNLTGDITEMLEALSCSNQSLELLDLTSSQLTGKLPNSLGQFNNLGRLYLSSNSLSGPIPASIGNLSSLYSLHLEGNMMNGEIPESIGQLTDLSELLLLQNNWQGTMTNTHFHNLTMLRDFSVSSKSSSFALKVVRDWVPPFTNLVDLEISDCQVGSAFPIWLRNMSLSSVILENVGISEEIPIWLFNMSSHISLIVLSQNKISGYLPKALNFSSNVSIDLSFNQLKGSIPLWSGVMQLYLRNNLLSGTIPVNIGKEMPYLTQLDLSNNYLSGSIPLSINKLQNLMYLDLSNNYLTGKIPIHWMGLWSLQIINLSNNSFSGGIPTSTCSAPSLSILDLSNNNLSGDLSLAFQNCLSLETIVLSKNKFFGSIPKEIPKNIPWLSELLLRGNTLTGSIPEDLCRLPALHVLDLAENRISGSIPACLGDLQGYKLPQTDFIFQPLFYTVGVETYGKHIELVLKGRIMDYFNRMLVQSIIDVSRNDLTGEIPEKLTELVHLGALNLSWNHLTGNIPSNIGSLTDLESLDLSYNHLSGPIPPSMTSLTFLSYLNLSYNNLSGQIPVANQFETFITDPSIYAGNPHLCGTPLPTNCSSSSSPGNGKQERRHEEDASEGEDKTERLWLYASIAFGYITGFWAVCGSLMLKRSWRHAYFNFMYDLRDKLLVFIAVNLARAKRRFGLERLRAQA